jgi:hypothetical protein
MVEEQGSNDITTAPVKRRPFLAPLFVRRFHSPARPLARNIDVFRHQIVVGDDDSVYDLLVLPTEWTLDEFSGFDLLFVSYFR